MKEFLNKLSAKENRTALLLVLVAVVGILIFILTSATFPFRDLLFNKLFPKPPSKAATVFPNNPDPNAYGLEISVNKILATSDSVYVGGSIYSVGPNTGSGVPISTASATPVDPFPYVQGPIRTVISDGNNGWYIGGYFNKVGSKDIKYLAHIFSDGTVDEAFDLQLSYETLTYHYFVSSLVLSPDKKTLYVGGYFNSVGGQTRYNLAAVDTTTKTVTDFNPDISDAGDYETAQVHSLALSSNGATLYAGGDFTTVGSQTRNSIAAINTQTGAPTDWNPNANASVLAMKLSPNDSTLYVGGYFGTIGTQSRSKIAALDTTTGIATSFNPNAGNTSVDRDVFTLDLTNDGAILYVGGEFDKIGTQARSKLAAIRTSDGTLTSFNPGFDDGASGTEDDVLRLLLSPDNSILYVGGVFLSVGGQNRAHLVSFETVTGNLTDWNPKVSFDTIQGRENGEFAFALALNQDETILYVGGAISSIGEKVAKVNNLIKLTPDGIYDPSFVTNIADNPATSDNECGECEDVWELILSPDGNTLYIGGTFELVDGQTRNNIAALDPATGSLKPFFIDVGELIPNNFGHVYAMALTLDGKTLYIGGMFDKVGGQARSRIAAVDTQTGIVVESFNPGLTPRYGTMACLDCATVWDLVLSPDDKTLYVGGYFTEIGGKPRYNLAAIETATGNVLDNFDPSAKNPSSGDNTKVGSLALTSNGNTLYAGGHFTTIQGQSKNFLAAIDASTGNLITSFDAKIDYQNAGQVIDIALSPDESLAYIAGSFAKINGETVANVASIQTATGAIAQWRPYQAFPFYNNIYKLAVSPDDNHLYAGGTFYRHFEIFSIPTPTPTPSPTPTLTPTSTPTPTPTPPPAGGGGDSGGGGGGGGGESPSNETFTPVVPQIAPKTGRVN